MFCTENKQTRGGSRTPGSSMIELFVTVEVISYWQSSTKLDDGGIVELPLYAIIFSFHDEAGIREESWMRARARGVRAFHILVPSTLVFLWNGAQREKFNFCFSRVFC